MEHREIYKSQETPEFVIELEYVQYDEEGKVYTWFVNIWKDDGGLTINHPWETYEDAECFFNEQRLQNVNLTKG